MGRIVALREPVRAEAVDAVPVGADARPRLPRGQRRLLERTLRPKGIDVDFLSPREAWLQALLVARRPALRRPARARPPETGGDLRKALRRWPHDPDFFAHREAGVRTSGCRGTSSTRGSEGVPRARVARGVGAKLTPKCAVETCRACGLDCAEHAERAAPDRRLIEMEGGRRTRHAGGAGARARGRGSRRGARRRRRGLDGRVVGRGANAREAAHDPTAHAELLAIQEAARTLGRWRLTGVTVFVTLEPCAMCAGAMVLARIDRLVFAASNPKAGAVGSLLDLSADPRLNHRFPVERGVLADEAGELLRAFFRARRGNGNGADG